MRNKGFTLIEILVVVLIIGILATIALPQYKLAVTKANVASILPIMRHIRDSLMEWKLTHGDYCNNGICPSLANLGIECPSGWHCDDGNMDNSYWSCVINDESNGVVYCSHDFVEDSGFFIEMYQPDENIYTEYAGMLTCETSGPKVHKVCEALGGKEIANGIYQL